MDTSLLEGNTDIAMGVEVAGMVFCQKYIKCKTVKLFTRSRGAELSEVQSFHLEGIQVSSGSKRNRHTAREQMVLKSV